MDPISALSTEYLRFKVYATVLDAPYNPTSDTVQFAFPASGNPVTWYAGSWETIGDQYVARVLVGPTGGVVTLTAGTYSVFMKITDSPEVPVRNLGTLTVI